MSHEIGCRISDDAVLDETARDQAPVVTDPGQAHALLEALLEALAGNHGAQAEFRAGAVWDHKGRDQAGDVSPLVSPSAYRDRNGLDTVYLSVSVRIDDVDRSPAVRSLVDQLRAQSQAARLADLEAEMAQRRQAREAEDAAMGQLQERIDALRATGR